MSVADASNLVGEVLQPYEWVRGQAATGMAIQELWAQYWGANYGSAEFWFAYAKYKTKLENLAVLLEKYSKDERSKALFVGAVSRLTGFFTPLYMQNAVSNLTQLDETFNIIHIASAMIPDVPKAKIEAATIDAIREDVSNLIAELDGVEMELQLKLFLKSNFTFLRWAINNYDKVGIDGLSKAYGMVASEFMRAWGDQNTEPAKAEPWWQNAKAKLKLIGEGVIWSEKFASGADKLLTHADDIVDALT